MIGKPGHAYSRVGGENAGGVVAIKEAGHQSENFLAFFIWPVNCSMDLFSHFVGQ